MTAEQLWRAVYPQLSDEVDLAGLTWDNAVESLRRDIAEKKKMIELLEKNRQPMDVLRRQFWEVAACAAMNGFLSVGDPEGVVAGAIAYADELTAEWVKRFCKATL